MKEEAKMSKTADNTNVNIEQDKRNQRVLQSRLRKELSRQQLRIAQQGEEARFYSQPAKEDLISEAPESSKRVQLFNETQSDADESLLSQTFDLDLYKSYDPATSGISKRLSASSAIFTLPTNQEDDRDRSSESISALGYEYQASSEFVRQLFKQPKQVNPVRLSDKPLALYRKSPETLEHNVDTHATIQSKYTADDTVLDVIRPGRDESKYVTIIPADEAKMIELEYEDWNRHRRIFLWLIYLALLLGVTINILTIYSARKFYLQTKHRYAFLQFLMHADTMIIGTVFISSLGLLVFRLFPNINGKIIIKIHILIFTFVTVVFIYGGLVLSFKYHKIVTGIPQHAYTLHAWTGTVIACFGALTIATGIFLTIRRNRTVGPLLKYHSAFGMITFMLCGSCCVSGYLVRALLFNGKSFTTYDSKTIMNNTTGILIVIFCVLVRYLTSDFRFRRRAKPEWDLMFARKVSQYEHDNLDCPGTLDEYARRIAAMPDF